MKERGMIFTAESVRAMLREKDPKTQTRRRCKQAHNEAGEPAQAVCQCKADGSWIAWWTSLPIGDWQRQTDECYPNGGGFRAPVAPGDRIYVKEAFYDYVPDHSPNEHVVGYRADAPADYNGPCFDVEAGVKTPIRWKSPLHMPRWASRLTLTVTDVRAQRVQEISEEDARAEGIIPDHFAIEQDKALRDRILRDNCYNKQRPLAVEMYAALWDSIHGPGAWERNDWVFAYTFEKAAR